jgi:hypothetical protein
VPTIGRMRKVLFAVALGLVGAALAFALPAWAAHHPVLIGRVGRHNAFKISLRFPSGRRVRTVPAGTYTFVIHDYSRIHNFALGSMTQNRRIFTGGIRFVGTKKYTVKLTPGEYAYACSAHPQRMHGSFVVTPATPPPPTTTATTTS